MVSTACSQRLFTRHRGDLTRSLSATNCDGLVEVCQIVHRLPERYTVIGLTAFSLFPGVTLFALRDELSVARILVSQQNPGERCCSVLFGNHSSRDACTMHSLQRLV